MPDKNINVRVFKVTDKCRRLLDHSRHHACIHTHTHARTHTHALLANIHKHPVFKSILYTPYFTRTHALSHKYCATTTKTVHHLQEVLPPSRHSRVQTSATDTRPYNLKLLLQTARQSDISQVVIWRNE